MDVYRIDTNPDPKKREMPRVLATQEMRHRWTYHAYAMSHDGRANLIFRGYGFDIQQAGKVARFSADLTAGNPGIYWSPDSRAVTFWTAIRPEDGVKGEHAQVGLAVLDLRQITTEMVNASQEWPVRPPYRLIYAPPKDHEGFGVEWSPSGEAVYVLERVIADGDRHTRLVRIPYPKEGEPTQVAMIGGMIDFFMPPVSRFEGGEGPSKRPYWIVFGHARGLFVVDPKGRHLRKLARLPATGLQNVEWHPGRKDQVALYFKHAMLNAQGQRFKGVYLVHLERIGREEAGSVVEEVYPNNDVHTLWYSPRGNYISWANGSTVYLRSTAEVDPEEGAPTVIELNPTVDDEPVEVKGFAWHAKEKKVAVAAGGALLVYDVEHPEREPLLAARLGRAASDFVAEPKWAGDEVTLTLFCDITPDPGAINRFGVTTAEPEEEPKDGAEPQGSGAGRRGGR